MIKFGGILCTDELNKYNERIPISTMLDIYEKQWNKPIASCANHDRTKAIGKIEMNGIVAVPNYSYLTNYFYIPENDDEEKKIKKFHIEYFQEELINKNKEQFTKLLKKIESYIVGKYEEYYTNGPMIYNPDVVKRIFPELYELRDKDGLISISNFSAILPGVFDYKGFALYVSPLFRRNFSYLNTLNTPFLERFLRLDSKQLDVKIALDFDSIGLLEEQKREFEYQYWWGPKFSDDLNGIEDGVCKHINDKYNYLLSPYKETEFGWYNQDNKHTFECEEIVDDPNYGGNDDLFACRFVHSMVDISNVPVHLDGAVRIYDLEKYASRISNSIDKFGRDATYIKLWRVDKGISIPEWKSLISDYYRDNMLIGEYFGGIDEKIEEEKRDDSISLEEFIPCNLEDEDGVMLNVSFLQSSIIRDGYDIEVLPFRAMNGENIVETLTPTINKLLSKGKKVFCPNVKHISCGDMVFNLPTYKCKDVFTANYVLNSLKEYSINNVEKIQSLISFGISYPVEDKTIVLSFAATQKSFNKVFLSNKFNQLSVDYKKWFIDTYKLISELFHPKKRLKITSFIEKGTLRIKRKEIPKSIVNEVKTTEKGQYLSITLEKQKVDFVKKHGIKFSLLIIEEEAECSNCGLNYFECNCIRTQKNNITLNIKKAQTITALWTNRKA